MEKKQERANRKITKKKKETDGKAEGKKWEENRCKYKVSEKKETNKCHTLLRFRASFTNSPQALKTFPMIF